MARVLASSARSRAGGRGWAPAQSHARSSALRVVSDQPRSVFAYPVPRYGGEGHPHPRNALHVDLGRHVVWRKRACPRRLGGEGVGAAVKWRSVAVVADSSLTKLEFSPWCTPARRCHVARSSSHRWARTTSVGRPAGLRTGAEVSGCSWFCSYFVRGLGCRSGVSRGLTTTRRLEGRISGSMPRGSPPLPVLATPRHALRHARVGSSLRSPRRDSSSFRVGAGLGRCWLGEMLGRLRSATAAAPPGPPAGRGSGSPESEHRVSA